MLKQNTLEILNKWAQERFETYSKRLSLRIEQELMVVRYVLFCRPSKKTIVALFLRISILLASFLVFASIQLSSNYIESTFLNVVVLGVFLWIVANFLWEFGYTIQHVKRYSAWLLMLLLLPLPLYISVYASTDTAKVTSQVTKRFQLSSYAFNATASTRTRTESRPEVDSWFKLNFAQMGVLKFSFVQGGLAEVAPETVAAIVGKPLAYPNPFRVSQGTEIGYDLTKDMDVEILVYNMFGNLVRQLYVFSGENGGRSDQYNRVSFDGRDAMGNHLGAGAYFYLIVSDGEVLGKGKMAVTP
jgi:hypothetical protein